jgi:hypothetical protein
MSAIESSSLLSKNIKIKVYRTTGFLLFCKGVKFGQNKNKRPPGSHCLQTLETATHVTRLWRVNGSTILITKMNVFCKTTNLFPWKKCPCWEDTHVTFTVLPGNWALWQSEILCEVLSYSNASNAAPCSNRLCTFPGTFVQSAIELNAIIFHYITV